MKAHELLLGLEGLLQRHAAGFELPSSVAVHTPAAVYLGDLPGDSANDLPERFPFALLQWAGGDLSHGQAPTNEGLDDVNIIVGVYSPTGPREAELICAAYADFLRALLVRHHLVAARFKLQSPLECRRPAPEKRQHRYHLFTILTRWDYALPGHPLVGNFPVSEGDLNG